MIIHFRRILRLDGQKASALIMTTNLLYSVALDMISNTAEHCHTYLLCSHMGMGSRLTMKIMGSYLAYLINIGFLPKPASGVEMKLPEMEIKED
jgi:hypothetical protein